MGSRHQTTGAHSPATIQQHQSLCWFCSLSSFHQGGVFLYLLFTVGFYSPRLRKELAVAQLDLQSRMKSSSGGEREKKKKQELVGNLKSLPYNYNKNTWIWVVSAARESAGVSIVMVNSQRGAVCATQRGSPPQWTGPGVKWEIKSPETCSPSKQLLSGWESARSRQPAAD